MRERERERDRQTDGEREREREREREIACVRPHAQVFMCLCECFVIDDRQYAQ